MGYSSKTEPYQMLMGAGQNALAIMGELHKEKQNSAILKAQLENQLLMAMMGRKDKEADRELEVRKLELEDKKIAAQNQYWQGLLKMGKGQGSQGQGSQAQLVKTRWGVLNNIITGDPVYDEYNQTIISKRPGILVRDPKDVNKIDPYATWKNAASVYKLLPKLGFTKKEFNAYLSSIAGVNPGPASEAAGEGEEIVEVPWWDFAGRRRIKAERKKSLAGMTITPKK